jgi:hypothetical protein
MEVGVKMRYCWFGSRWLEKDGYLGELDSTSSAFSHYLPQLQIPRKFRFRWRSMEQG